MNIRYILLLAETITLFTFVTVRTCSFDIHEFIEYEFRRALLSENCFVKESDEYLYDLYVWLKFPQNSWFHKPFIRKLGFKSMFVLIVFMIYDICHYPGQFY